MPTVSCRGTLPECSAPPFLHRESSSHSRFRPPLSSRPLVAHAMDRPWSRLRRRGAKSLPSCPTEPPVATGDFDICVKRSMTSTGNRPMPCSASATSCRVTRATIRRSPRNARISWQSCARCACPSIQRRVITTLSAESATPTTDRLPTSFTRCSDRCTTPSNSNSRASSSSTPRTAMASSSQDSPTNNCRGSMRPSPDSSSAIVRSFCFFIARSGTTSRRAGTSACNRCWSSMALTM